MLVRHHSKAGRQADREAGRQADREGGRQEGEREAGRDID